MTYANNTEEIAQQLLEKYNKPLPRYTSYPTVPFWQGDIDVPEWKSQLHSRLLRSNNQEGISLYIHLPFCESLCTYCGCNKKITQNHDVEKPYIDAVLKEWQLYLNAMPEKPLLRELHLGGGTPTFFSTKNLKRLLDGIKAGCILHQDHEFSFEGHPNNTTKEHLLSLYDAGFRRVSFGVQDNDPVVQHAINRIQPFENVRRVTEQAREIGYRSVNFDLIYGLPFQTEQSIRNTVEATVSLLPDRVAFYSYAHVPWTSRGQRLFDENDLPSAQEKLTLYMLGTRLFEEAGYTDIGMDHFALPGDDLYKAWKQGWLHRNFMGYTTQKTSMVLGLGVSAISDISVAYAQNHKTLHDYYQSIEKQELPLAKGCSLSEEDIAFKRYILDIICSGSTHFLPEHTALLEEFCFPVLRTMEEDELFEWDDKHLQLTDKGRPFMRNICSAFDLYLQRKANDQPANTFSKAI